MDRETAAVAMDYAPKHLQTIWSTASLTRAELKFQSEDAWGHVLETSEDFAMAVELECTGDDVGPNGYVTNYTIRGCVSDHVIEHENVSVDSDIAQKFADLWANELVDVIKEAQEATSLSPKEFATYITMNNDACGEARAAESLGITVGTYRGKVGRIKNKQKACSNTEKLSKLLDQPQHGPSKYERTIGEHGPRPSAITPLEIDEHQRNPSVYTTTKYPESFAPLRLPRESPNEREQETYEQGHWQTSHVKDIDKIYVADTSRNDYDETVRIDFDGRGSGGASMHDSGENVQISAWFNEYTARRLYDELGEYLEEQ